MSKNRTAIIAFSIWGFTAFHALDTNSLTTVHVLVMNVDIFSKAAFTFSPNFFPLSNAESAFFRIPPTSDILALAIRIAPFSLKYATADFGSSFAPNKDLKNPNTASAIDGISIPKPAAKSTIFCFMLSQVPLILSDNSFTTFSVSSPPAKNRLSHDVTFVQALETSKPKVERTPTTKSFAVLNELLRFFHSVCNAVRISRAVCFAAIMRSSKPISPDFAAACISFFPALGSITYRIRFHTYCILSAVSFSGLTMASHTERIFSTVP